MCALSRCVYIQLASLPLRSHYRADYMKTGGLTLAHPTRTTHPQRGGASHLTPHHSFTTGRCASHSTLHTPHPTTLPEQCGVPQTPHSTLHAPPLFHSGAVPGRDSLSGAGSPVATPSPLLLRAGPDALAANGYGTMSLQVGCTHDVVVTGSPVQPCFHCYWFCCYWFCC